MPGDRLRLLWHGGWTGHRPGLRRQNPRSAGAGEDAHPQDRSADPGQRQSRGAGQNPIETVQADRLDHYAKCIGLSFQIKDDILDEESDTQTLGKTQGKDRDHNKPNYPALLGLAGAKQKAQELHEAALDSLSGFGDEADLLRELSRFIIDRRH